MVISIVYVCVGRCCGSCCLLCLESCVSTCSGTRLLVMCVLGVNSVGWSFVGVVVEWKQDGFAMKYVVVDMSEMISAMLGSSSLVRVYLSWILASVYTVSCVCLRVGILPW